MYGKSYYEVLIDKVAKIDKDASDYLRKAPYELKCFRYHGKLNSCFVWYDTPQGHDYWENIYKKLIKTELANEG